MKTLFLIFLSFVSLFAKVKISFSHENVKHGTTFAVVFQSDEAMSKAPNVVFLDKTYQMFTIDGNISKYEVFVPVDYHTPLKEYEVQVTYIQNDTIKKEIKNINIVDGKYKKNEIIKVAKGKVILSQKNKERTKVEYDKVYAKVYSKITPYDLTQDNFFENPMNSDITSDFGNARIYNGKARSYHTGTDFRAKTGSPIYASNNGKVVLSMDRFYLGRVVYIDHGRGAYSYYSHMNSIKVKEGELVKKGDLLGYSGKTGRVTGPHLHYAMRLYNTTVDPLQYHSVYNEILKKYH